MSDQDMIRITIAGRTLEEWTDFARTDRCLDQMVPSDLRMLVASHRDATATIALLRVPPAFPAVTSDREARLVEALSFYRDAWKYKINNRYGGLEWSPKDELLDDCGNRARALLAELETTK
jgi:hypothetical protein